MFGFGKKNLQWKNLSDDQKRTFAANLTKAVKAFHLGAKYKVVSSPYDSQRDRGSVETVGEDQILDVYQRGRLLNLARNQVRNSPEFNGLLKTLDLNVIGNGGKCVIGIDSDDARQIRDEFAKWCHNADFFDSLSFRDILKIVLKEYVCGGDCVLLYDFDIEGSGKLLVYESDEIGDSDGDSVQRYYGKGCTSSLGKVRSPNGRWIGTIVSRSCRGLAQFPADKCYFLKRDPNASSFDNFWIQPANCFRVCQGRGVSQMASIIPTVDDVNSLVDYELASAKKNASMIAQIINTDTGPSNDQAIPSAFDAQEIQAMTDEQIKALVESEKEEVQTYSLAKMNAAGCVFEQMPKNYKMEMLTSSNHPNTNLKEFVLWLQSRAASPFGLGAYYATLGQSGDYDADSIISWRSFYDAQKFIEQICDWTFVQWSKWATTNGIIDISKLGDGWINKISWIFPKKDDVNEVERQNAIKLGLENLTMNYLDVLGPNWKEHLTQTAIEQEWLKKKGLPLVAYNMISGGEKTGVDKIDDSDFTGD